MNRREDLANSENDADVSDPETEGQNSVPDANTSSASSSANGGESHSQNSSEDDTLRILLQVVSELATTYTIFVHLHERRLLSLDSSEEEAAVKKMKKNQMVKEADKFGDVTLDSFKKWNIATRELLLSPSSSNGRASTSRCDPPQHDPPQAEASGPSRLRRQREMEEPQTVPEVELSDSDDCEILIYEQRVPDVIDICSDSEEESIDSERAGREENPNKKRKT